MALGDPGVGKTALLNAVAREAAPAGVRVWVCGFADQAKISAQSFFMLTTVQPFSCDCLSASSAPAV